MVKGRKLMESNGEPMNSESLPLLPMVMILPIKLML